MSLSDSRGAERYLAKEPIPGSFGAASVAILNLSDCGAMIEHAQPLRIATKGRLWFKQGDVTITARAVVIWSHLSKQPNKDGKYLYHSGMRVETGGDELAQALIQLATRGALVLDVDSLERKRTKSGPKPASPPPPPTPEPELSPDQALLIHHALKRLREHPDEARRWYEKVKDTAPDNVVKYGREVMALWSYLEGTIDAHMIARCLGK